MSRRTASPKVIGAVAGALAAAWALPAAAARCPSYQRGTAGSQHCGLAAVPGTDPTLEQWKAFVELAAQGPKKWGDRGPSIPNLKAGCQAGGKVEATFPCEILGALIYLESSWHQFCSPTEPASELHKPAQTLITRDCGHGVAQVTSGMHEGESAPFDRQRVASDPFYNLAVGASILAAKWQSAGCIGSRSPAVLEHWYTALWKYNGYSYSNDPSNPAYSATRGIWNPAVGGDAPYQEKVFGIVELGSAGGKRWKPVALAYPRIEEVAGRTGAPVSEPACASPTDCTQKRATHRTGCSFAEAEAVAGTGGGGGKDAGTDGSKDAGTGAVVPVNDEQPVPQEPQGPKKCGCASGGEGLGPLALALLWGLGRRRRPAGR